jgi:hypothetical protein
LLDPAKKMFQDIQIYIQRNDKLKFVMHNNMIGILIINPIRTEDNMLFIPLFVKNGTPNELVSGTSISTESVSVPPFLIKYLLQ